MQTLAKEGAIVQLSLSSPGCSYINILHPVYISVGLRRIFIKDPVPFNNEYLTSPIRIGGIDSVTILTPVFLHRGRIVVAAPE